MKIYSLRDFKDGDMFDKYFFSLDEARKAAQSTLNHLTDSEKKERTVDIVGYEISIEAYKGTADDLVTDLCNGDVVCCEYDVCFGFNDSANIFYESVL